MSILGTVAEAGHLGSMRGTEDHATREAGEGPLDEPGSVEVVVVIRGNWPRARCSDFEVILGGGG